MADPRSIAEWLTLCAQHERAAVKLAEDKVAAGQAMFHAAVAVECALKAAVWHKERFNQWPSRGSRPDIYTHDLRALVRLAGIELNPAEPTAPSWHIMLQWDRAQSYEPKRMPRKVAQAYVEAAFGKDGVVTWLRRKLKNAS